MASKEDIILAPAGGSRWNATFNNDHNKKSAAGNKLKNASAAASSGKETAHLTLRGYPLLKAKKTIEITGVGKGSGKWYCKSVVQQWHVDHGYLTNAVLTKGANGGKGSGSGGSGVQTSGTSGPPTQ